MKRPGSRNIRSTLRRRQATLFLSWLVLVALAGVAAFFPGERRATVELRVEPGTLANGVALVAPPIEARLDALVRGVLQETQSPSGAQILAVRRPDGRVVECSAHADDDAHRLAQALLAADLKDRHELTEKARNQAETETVQATEAERANRAAIELLRPQGVASTALVTSRTLAAVVTLGEGKVKDDQAAVVEQESDVLALEAEVRLKHDQLLDESAAARKLLDKGQAVRPPSDGTSPLAKLPGWTSWRAATAKLEAAQQKLSATRTRLAKHQLELERLRDDADRWPERAAVLARLEEAQPGLKRALEDARGRRDRAVRALDVELGKDASSTPERLVLATPGANAAPDTSEQPRELLFLVAVVLAIPIAVLLALVRDWQDRSLYQPETWRDALGAPVLGRVPDLTGPGAALR